MTMFTDTYSGLFSKISPTALSQLCYTNNMYSLYYAVLYQ